jgi:excisionase family DNA binding protein
MNLPSDTLLNVREIAALFGVGRTTIYAWIHRGVIPRPLLIGGVSRWRRSDVDRIVQGKRGLRKPHRPGESNGQAESTSD